MACAMGQRREGKDVDWILICYTAAVSKDAKNEQVECGREDCAQQGILCKDQPSRLSLLACP